MTIPLTPSQAETLKAHLRPGHVLIAKIAREAFNGTNPDSSGTLLIDFIPVSESTLTAIREIIRKERL